MASFDLIIGYLLSFLLFSVLAFSVFTIIHCIQDFWYSGFFDSNSSIRVCLTPIFSLFAFVPVHLKKAFLYWKLFNALKKIFLKTNWCKCVVRHLVIVEFPLCISILLFKNYPVAVQAVWFCCFWFWYYYYHTSVIVLCALGWKNIPSPDIFLLNPLLNNYCVFEWCGNEMHQGCESELTYHKRIFLIYFIDILLIYLWHISWISLCIFVNFYSTLNASNYLKYDIVLRLRTQLSLLLTTTKFILKQWWAR